MLPLLCPEIHILLLVALPSPSYDLGVRGKEKKKTFFHVNFSISTDSFAYIPHMYIVLCQILNRQVLKQLIAAKFIKISVKKCYSTTLVVTQLVGKDSDFKPL